MHFLFISHPGTSSTDRLSLHWIEVLGPFKGCFAFLKINKDAKIYKIMHNIYSPHTQSSQHATEYQKPWVPCPWLVCRNLRTWGAPCLCSSCRSKDGCPSPCSSYCQRTGLSSHSIGSVEGAMSCPWLLHTPTVYSDRYGMVWCVHTCVMYSWHRAHTGTNFDM